MENVSRTTKLALHVSIPFLSPIPLGMASQLDSPREGFLSCQINEVSGKR